jgi:N-acyl-L-homoserine lactone synthetase
MSVMSLSPSSVENDSFIIRDSESNKPLFSIRQVLPLPSSSTHDNNNDEVKKSILNRIGRFRYDLWNEETTIDKTMFPDGIWLDQYDDQALQWIAEEIETGNMVAVARMTIHEHLVDNPDAYLWLEREDLKDNLPPEPSANISKLAVHKTARCYGIAKKLSELRLNKARSMGIKSVLVTASVANTRILQSLSDGNGDWKDTGIRVIFPNRPQIEFLGLELRFTQPHACL